MTLDLWRCLSLSVLFSKFTHIVAYISINFFLLWHYIECFSLIHWWAFGLLVCFKINDFLNNYVWGLSGINSFFYRGYKIKSGIIGSYWNLAFDNCQAGYPCPWTCVLLSVRFSFLCLLRNALYFLIPVIPGERNPSGAGFAWLPLQFSQQLIISNEVSSQVLIAYLCIFKSVCQICYSFQKWAISLYILYFYSVYTLHAITILHRK